MGEREGGLEEIIDEKPSSQNFCHVTFAAPVTSHYPPLWLCESVSLLSFRASQPGGRGPSGVSLQFHFTVKPECLL